MHTNLQETLPPPPPLPRAPFHGMSQSGLQTSASMRWAIIDAKVAQACLREHAATVMYDC